MNTITDNRNYFSNILTFINKHQHFLSLMVIVSIAFLRNMEAIKDVYYGYYGYDTDRDLGNLNNLIEGNYGKDLSYIGEYMWYNPLITYVQYALFKITGLSPAYLVVQSGPFLNLMCPFIFYFMVAYLFNKKIALASSAALIFFTLGEMNSILSATYSPWNFAGTFSQTIFYLAIIVMCKAFSKPGVVIFILTGIITGIAFLGHSAPGIILVLLFGFLLVNNFIISNLEIKLKGQLKDFFKYGFLFCITFLLASLPLLYYAFGKYKLHMINLEPSQWDGTGVEFQYFPHLIKQSFSFSLIISIIGIFNFIKFKKKTDGNNRNLLLGWFLICTLLYVYINLASIIRIKFGVTFPGLVPSFHFIFYLKALQSVFFGVGFCYVIEILISKLKKYKENFYFILKLPTSISVSVFILLISLIYYPVYSNRYDFTYHKAVERKKSRIDLYQWLINNTNINDVIISNESLSLFPVMASGRKLVCSNKFMVNPYVHFEDRFEDNKKIMTAVVNGQIYRFRDLFEKYNIKYILIENNQIGNNKDLETEFGPPLYRNNELSIYRYIKNN